jgi:hypothetical protein
MFLKKIGSLIIVFVCSLNANAQTAEEIISKYIAFTGGEEQWKNIKTIITSGTYNYGGIEFPFTAYSKAPNLYKFVVPFNGKYYAQAFNGKEGWKIDAFKNETKRTPLTGKAALAMANEADFELESPFIDYQKKGHQAIFEGTDTANTTPCYKLKLIRNNSDIETYFFDKADFKLVKKTATSKNAEMENATLNTFYSDYQKVDSIEIPYTSISKTDDGQTILTITIKKVEINTPIPNTEFE